MRNFNYFDIEPIISRNALMTFVISSRGAGKTYSAKTRIIRRFEKAGKKFLFLKRTETELDATVDGFWDDFATEKRVFKHQKNRFYIGKRTVDTDDEGNEVEEINWQLFGYSAALSTTAKLKGISPQGVETVLWDEFVAYDGRYLRDEATRLLDVMETVGRMRDDVRLIGTGNKNEDGYYPVFYELGLSKASDFADNKIYSFKGGTIVIYSFTNEAYIKEKKKTKLGRVAKGTSYYEKMIDNKNDSNFGELVWHDRPKRLRSVFSIVIDSEYFNVYFCAGKRGERMLYIEKTDKPLQYAYTLDGTIPTLPRLVANGYNLLYGYITSGRVRFDTQITAQKTIETTTKRKR